MNRRNRTTAAAVWAMSLRATAKPRDGLRPVRRLTEARMGKAATRETVRSTLDRDPQRLHRNAIPAAGQTRARPEDSRFVAAAEGRGRGQHQTEQEMQGRRRQRRQPSRDPVHPPLAHPTTRPKNCRPPSEQGRRGPQLTGWPSRPVSAVGSSAARGPHGGRRGAARWSGTARDSSGTGGDRRRPQRTERGQREPSVDGSPCPAVRPAPAPIRVASPPGPASPCR